MSDQMTTVGRELIMKRCDQCCFSSKERPQPTLLVDVLICRWGPPTPVVIPSGPGQASMQPMWPVVAPLHWCHRFSQRPTPLEGISNDV